MVNYRNFINLGGNDFMKFTCSRLTLLAAGSCLTLLALALIARAIFPFSPLPLTVHAQGAAGITTGEGKPHMAKTRKEYESGSATNATGALSTVNTIDTAAPFSNLLQYHGGPVMQSPVVSYAIFWEPPTLQDGTATSVSPNYNSLIEQYLNDVNGSGLYNNNTQYFDTSGHIANNAAFGGA